MSSTPSRADDASGAASIFDAPDQGLLGRFAGGAFFTLGSQAIRMSVQIASLAVLSRLLTPSSFGVMAMAMPVVLFAGLLQELGITQASVQKPVLTQLQSSNMFWASMAVGCAVTLLMAAVSPLVSLFYGDGRVGKILLASAPLALITGAGLQHRALLMRNMMFRQLAMRDIAGVLAGVFAAVTCAMVWRSYWALFAANAASAIVSTGGAMIATRWAPSRPSRDPEFRNMIGFGAGVSGYFLANFITRNMDNVLIGRFWGGAALGLYDRGYRILLFPLQQINQPIVQVLVPTLSRLNADPDRYRETYVQVLRVILMLTLPGILALYFTADWLVPLLLGRQWVGAIPIFRNLAMAGAVQTFNGPLGALFITQARTAQYARWGAFSAVVCTLSFVIGLPWGPAGVALAYALNEVFVRSPLYWWYSTRQGPVRLRDLASIGGPFVLATAVVGMLLWCGRALWSPQSGLVGLATFAPASYALFWGVIALFPSGRATFRVGLGLAQRILRTARNPRQTAEGPVNRDP